MTTDDDMTGGTGDHDLDIVSAGMRLAYDDAAMRDLFEAWDDRLAATGRLPNERDDARLFGHLKALGPLFDSLDEDILANDLERTIRDVAAPAFVFTADRVVVELNDLAAARYGIRQSAACDFAFVDPVSVADLNAVCAAARGRGNRQRVVIQITAEDDSRSFAEVFTLTMKGQDRALISLRNLEIEWRADVGEQLQEAFDLSDAEVDICRLLYCFQSTEKIAELRGRSRRTIGVQLSSIFQKTGTDSQIGLFRLLAFICARDSVGQRSEFQKWADPYGREQVFPGPGGEQIAWSWMGAPDGRPVLFLHGLTVGYAMDGRAEKRLADAGLKLIALQRPGHGSSDPGPRGDAVADGAAAAKALIGHLKLPPCLGVGLGSATAPLIELATTEPSLITGLMSIGGYLPMSRAAYLKTQPVMHRAGFTIYRTSPWLVSILCKRFLGSMKRKGFGHYLDLAYKEAPLDQKTINSDTVRPLIMNACSLMSAQGMDAFGKDMALFLHDWIDLIPRLSVPYTILHGEHDPTARADQLADVVRRHNLLSLEVFEGAGELIFYADPMRWVDALIRFEANCRPAA